jgi:hypothetical protein
LVCEKQKVKERGEEQKGKEKGEKEKKDDRVREKGGPIKH